MKHYKLLLLTILCITSLFAESNQKISLQLLWKHQFEFTGFYMAKEKGFYKDLGLDVVFKEYQIGSNISQDVISGKADFGVGYSGIILDKLNGDDIKLLNAIYQSSPHVLVSLQSSNINSIKDFKGKKISMTNSHSKTANIKSMIYSQKISLDDIRIEKFSYGIDALMDKKTDLQSVYLSNEIFKLQKKKIAYKIWDPKDYGFSFYDNILFTSTKLIAKNPKLVKDFQKASLMGWEYAFNNIDETIELILKKYNTLNKTKEALTYEANELKKLAYYETKTLGKIEESKIQRIIDIYNLMGLVQNTIPITEFIYNPNQKKIILTNEEKKYLKSNPTITVHNETDWAPFNYNENNEPKGFSIDYMNLLAEKTNLEVKYITGTDWSKFIQMIKNKKLDVMLNIIQSKKREKFIDFTSSYEQIKQSLFTNLDNIKSLKDLSGKTIALPKDFYIIEYIEEHYPDIKIQTHKNIQECIYAVIEKRADALIENFTVVNYILQKYNLSIKNVKLNLGEEFDFEMRIGVVKNNPLLKNILQKAMNSITQEEINAIKNKWSITNNTINKSKLNLTRLEIEHLKNKETITMCIDPNWMPFKKFEKGEYIGITADYFKIFEQNLGKKIKVITTKTWNQSLEFSKSRKCDLLSLTMETTTKKKYLNFTTPYLKVPLVVATRLDVTFINDIKALEHKPIGIPKGYAYAELLKIKYPFLNIVEVENLNDGLEKVRKGNLFGYIGTLASVGYMFQTQYTGELKIAGKFDETWELGIGVRNDDAILLNIMEKVIQSIDNAQSQTILSKWLAIKYEKKVDYTLLWQVLVAILIIAFFIIYRQVILNNVNKNLQKIVDDKTKELQLLNETLENKVEQRTQELNVSKMKIKESYNEIKHILDSTMECVFIFENGYCIDVNDETVRLFGYPDKNTMLGKKATEFVANNSVVTVANNIQNNYTKAYEIEMKRYDGTTFPGFVKGSSFTRRDKLVRVTTALDLTELKSKESLLIQQSKMAALGEMIANISHQWRQPLSIITTVASGIKLKLEYNVFNKEDEIKNLDILINSATYLSTTIDDFKNFINPKKINKKFNIKTIINKTIEMFGKNFSSHGIDIITNIKDTETIGNENELLQVIINILNNSKDVLTSQKLDKKLIFIDIDTLDENIIISIKDNGGGINNAILSQIFDAYFTTKHKSIGTGIGLYMSYQIIKNSFNGSIIASNEKFNYENNIYYGAKFTISLPINNKV